MGTPFDSKEFKEKAVWSYRAKRQNLEVSDCISIWCDICGFGKLLEESKWELNSLQQSKIFQLLGEFHELAGRPSLINVDPFPSDKAIILNDGVAKTVDLTHKDKLNGPAFLFFLRDIIGAHYILLKLTKSYGVGLRTIFAGGERVQYAPSMQTGHSFLYYDEENISDHGKDLLKTNYVYNPSEFQMNTAFAKAFTLDNLGSKNGIKVNGFYIEKSFFEKVDGVPGVKIEISDSNIKIYKKEILVFKLSICETLDIDLKGIGVTVFHIDRFIIYKEFDGDYVELEMFREFNSVQ